MQIDGCRQLGCKWHPVLLQRLSKGNGIMDETEWELVSMFLPNFDDVMEIHDELVEMFRADEDPIEPPGARDENLVHSACHRPHTGIGD